MNIAICDDIASERTLLSNYLKMSLPDITLSEYADGNTLVQDHNKNQFDLIVLDMLMPIINGIQTAEKIRTFDEHTPIIFVTNSEEFALQSYRVLAFDYLVKPITAETMKRCLSRLIKKMPDKRFITVNYLKVHTDILLSNILYIESNLRKVIFHLSGQKEVIVTAKLGDFFSLTDEPDFCRCHKSYIVNLNYVTTLLGEDFLLTNDRVIRISRTFSTTAKKKYFDYVFGQGSRHP